MANTYPTPYQENRRIEQLFNQLIEELDIRVLSDKEKQEIINKLLNIIEHVKNKNK